MKRQLVIGDLHGGLKALKQVLQRSRTQPEDHLIFLGDYVDGWSESAQTVDFLIDLSKEQKCTFIRGNHDTLVLQWLKNDDLNPKWLRHGGQSSINSYSTYVKKDRQRHIDFFESLEDYYLDPENRLFLHAGFQNQNGPEFEWSSLSFYWDRTLWELVTALDKSIKPGDLNYPKRLTHHKEIFIGHTPTTRIGYDVPIQRSIVWNVDTGAAFKGPVSLMDVATKEFWQSEPVYTFYPEETGRNE